MPKKQKRSALVGILSIILASALGLSACSGGTVGNEQADVNSLDKGTRLVVGDIASDLKDNLGAAEQLEGINYNAQFTPISDFTTIYSSLASGKLDVGVWGLDANGLLAVQNGAKVKLVGLYETESAQSTDTNGGLFGVVVKTNSGITSTSQLKGKRIATGGTGITPDVTLTAALAAHGLKQDDTKVARFQDSTSQVSAFQKGETDAYAGSFSNKQILNLISSGKAQVLFSSDRATNVRFVVAASDTALNDPKKSAAIGDFIRRISYFYQWRSQPSALTPFTQAVAKVTKSDSGTAKRIAELQAKSALPLPFGSQTSKTLQGDLDKYQKWGYLKKPITVDDLVDNRFADDVEAGAKAAKSNGTSTAKASS